MSQCQPHLTPQAKEAAHGGTNGSVHLPGATSGGSDRLAAEVITTTENILEGRLGSVRECSLRLIPPRHCCAEQVGC